MEGLSIILRGLILGLSITAPVGPTNIEVLRRGLREGWQAAAMFCLGVILALVLYLILVTFGLSFLTTSPFFNTLLTVLGVLVLAYLAYQSIRAFFTGTEMELETPTSGNRHFVPGVVLTLSNPAVLLLWTGIMGADFAASQVSVGQGLLLSFGILVGVTIFFTLLTLAIHYGRQFLQRRYLRYVSLIAGIALLFFCLRFAGQLLARIF